MKDSHWSAVHRAIAPRVKDKDTVLAPRGNWAPFGCPVRFYDATIALEDATVFILHKGRMPGLAKADLAKVAAQWQCVFANEVFLVFARPVRRRRLPALLWPSDHLRLVYQHLHARRLKVMPTTIYYVHVPKAGGTSVWQALSRLFPSKVYYSDMATLLAHPPEVGEYDLVGLHGAPALIADRLQGGDRIVGLLRDPIARFLSTVTHCRRATEDPMTFTPVQRAMRDMPVSEFLGTPFGRDETRMQTLLLGTSPGPASDDARLQTALTLIERDDTLFAPIEEAGPFLRRLIGEAGASALHLPRQNQNAMAEYARHDTEFKAVLPRLEAMSQDDRRLFEAVATRFARAA